MDVCYFESSVSVVFSDEDLVRQSRLGSSRATERLLSKYRPLVENKARTYFLLGADHDDVVQEGMIGLYKAIRDFRDDRMAHFRGFADLCVTRQIITAVKNATRQKHLPLNAYLSLNRTVSSDAEAENMLIECLPDIQQCDPEASLLQQREKSRRLDAARQKLSTLEMRVLESYLQGKTYREISVELRCQMKTIDNALQRIKRKLSALLPD